MVENEQDILKVIFAGTFLMLFLGGCIVFFIIAYKRRQDNYRRERAQLEQKFQQEILRTQLEIQEQTMKNIAQEIHDNIGQTLSLAKLNLNTIDLSAPQRSPDKISNTKELVGKAIHDLRSLSKTLNTDAILSTGLVRAIEYELQLVQRTGVFETELKLSGQPHRLDPQKELILFRIVQEAINNIIKHSGAQKIVIQIGFSSDFYIKIQDDGKGVDALTSTADAEGRGTGMLNMQSRAELIGGRFHLESSSVTGTQIHITVPMMNI